MYFLKTIFFLSVVVILAFLFVSYRNGLPADQKSTSAVVTIDASSTHDSKLTLGFLHGISDVSNLKETIALVDNLRPRLWRTSNIVDTYLILDKASVFSEKTEIVWVIQDAFYNKIRIDPACPPDLPRPGELSRCYATYDELVQEWTAEIDFIIRELDRLNFRIDYYDIFAEPDNFWAELKIEESEKLFNLFRIAHDIVRKYHPEAKISAPDFSAFDQQTLEKFMSYAAENNLKIDNLTWHEFHQPTDVISHTRAIKAQADFIYTKKPWLKPTEFSITEYMGPQAPTVPANAVFWIDALEKAGVDKAVKACWDESSAFQKWSNCRNGLDGILTKDNAHPRPIYWVYQRYAEFSNKRFKVDTSDTKLQLIASEKVNSKEIHMLVGAATSFSWADIVVNGVNDTEYVSATVEILPNSVDSLDVTRKIVLAVEKLNGNTLKVRLPDVREGYAYVIQLKLKN